MASATIDPPNPVKLFRETVLRKGRTEAAFLTGVPYAHWYAAEAGLKPPTRRMLAVLASLGHDSSALLTAYRQWVAARSVRLVAQELRRTASTVR
jgi:hypothetical protein